MPKPHWVFLSCVPLNKIWSGPRATGLKTRNNIYIRWEFKTNEHELKQKPTINEVLPLVEFGLFHWDTWAIKVTTGLIYPRRDPHRKADLIHSSTQKRFPFFFPLKHEEEILSLITLLGNSIYKKELAKITRSLFIWESQFIDYKKKKEKKNQSYNIRSVKDNFVK